MQKAEEISKELSKRQVDNGYKRFNSSNTFNAENRKGEKNYE